VCQFTTGLCGYLGSTWANNANYLEWLKASTNNWTTFPSYDDLIVRRAVCDSLNYWDFMKDFGTNPNNTTYNKPCNINLQPQEINYLNNHTCN
jgi:hypothetical protein